MTRSPGDPPNAGFTLFEALIATALMSMILGALATVTAQWLPNWNRGVTRVQHNEHLALGLERITADLAAAEFVAAHRETMMPFFEGGPRAVTLVRTDVGTGAKPGLEIIRIAEVNDTRGTALVRTRTPFFPKITNAHSDGLRFDDPVVLLRAPYRVSFAYSGRDRIWRDEWRRNHQLPQAIKLTLYDGPGRQSFFSTAVLLHAEISVECLGAKSLNECLSKHLRPSPSDDRDSSRS